MRRSPTPIRSCLRWQEPPNRSASSRKPAASDNPFVAAQEKVSEQIVKALDAWRETLEKLSEKMFLAIYGSPVLQAAVGVNPEAARPRRPGKSLLHRELVQKRIAELKSQITKGGLQECTIRGLIYVGMARGYVDERGVAALRRIRLTEEGSRLTLAQFKAMAREQFFLLLLDPEATLAAIPKLLPARRCRAAEGPCRHPQRSERCRRNLRRGRGTAEKGYGAVRGQ